MFTKCFHNMFHSPTRAKSQERNPLYVKYSNPLQICVTKVSLSPNPVFVSSELQCVFDLNRDVVQQWNLIWSQIRINTQALIKSDPSLQDSTPQHQASGVSTCGVRSIMVTRAGTVKQYQYCFGKHKRCNWYQNEYYS